MSNKKPLADKRPVRCYNHDMMDEKNSPRTHMIEARHSPAQLHAALEQKLRQQESVVAAVDGPSASGKTTLAKALADRYGGRIVAMDDFFLPPALRTPARYETPGGNVHYERFLEEVAPGLRTGSRGGAIEYRPFDCSVMQYGAPRSLEWTPLTIVEGSYSLHEHLRALYDVTVFLTVDPDVQRSRLLEREGSDRLPEFLRRWIPLEQLYIERMKPDRASDFIL